jgi:hypothetical protein
MASDQNSLTYNLKKFTHKVFFNFRPDPLTELTEPAEMQK